MRIGWLLLAVATTSLSAQNAPPRRTALEAIVREADTVPPEFGADILIRAAQAAGRIDVAWERDLLDEAFRRAYSAQQPYRRTSAPLPPDTRQHAEAIAADTPLDTLSLQVRVVQLMRLLHPVHARELFEWIALSVEPSACDSALVPALDEYYLALATLARETFPKTSAGRADALSFLELYLWRARLPSEMPAVVRALDRIRRTREEAAYFERLLYVLLESSNADPRGFSVAGADTVQRVTELELGDKTLGVDASFLSEGLRKHLLAQFKAARCGDSTAEARIADAFNAMLKRTGADNNVHPLAAFETAPARTLDSTRIDLLWQSAEARELHDEAIDLRGPAAKPVEMRVRLTRDWLERAERHLVRVDQWTGFHEAAERDYFFEKGVLYIGLLDLVPHVALRARVFRSFAEFLRHSDAQQRRQLWFAVAARLIELTRSDDSPQLLPILESSGDRVLALYAHAARLFNVDRLPAPSPAP